MKRYTEYLPLRERMIAEMGEVIKPTAQNSPGLFVENGYAGNLMSFTVTMPSGKQRHRGYLQSQYVPELFELLKTWLDLTPNERASKWIQNMTNHIYLDDEISLEVYSHVIVLHLTKTSRYSTKIRTYTVFLYPELIQKLHDELKEWVDDKPILATQ